MYPIVRCANRHEHQVTEKEAKEGYACPNCGLLCKSRDVVSSTQTESEEPSPEPSPALEDDELEPDAD